MAQFNRNDKREDEFSENVVALNRVAKTVKGGRNMRFSVTVVVGNGEALSAADSVKLRKFLKL